MSTIQFLYPSVLWAWLFLLVPVLIHLFNFRKYKTVYFTNVSLLKSIKKDTRSKSRLKQLLVLLMRLLFLFFLVLAFSQPYIQKDNSKAYNNDKIVILLDNSFSMSAKGELGIKIEYAKRKALEILNAYPKNVKMMLVTSDVEAKQLFFKSKNEIVSELAKVQISPFARKLDEVFKVINNKLKKNKLGADVYIISDYQKSDFDILFNDSLPFKMIYLQTLPSDNVSLDTAYFLSPIHAHFSQNELVYTISNKTQNDLVDFPVELNINNSIKSISTVSIPSNSTVNDTIRFFNSNRGIQHCFLSIQDLPVTFDNQLFFNYKNIDQVQTVLIADEYNLYLKALFKDNPFFNAIYFSPSNIDYNAIEQSDLLVFVENETSLANTSQFISEYLKSGSKVLHFTSFKSNFLESIGIRQIKLDTTVSTISDLNLHSDLFKDAFEIKDNAYDLPKIKSEYGFEKSISTLLFDDKEQGFVFVKSLGDGQILSFSVPLIQENYDFYSHPIIIPIIYNFSAKQETQPLYYYTNNNGVAFIKKTSQHTSQVISIEGTQKQTIPQQYSRGSLIKIILPERLDQGFYFFKSGDSTIGAFSVNNSRKETSSTFYSLKELKKRGCEVFDAQFIQSDNVSVLVQNRLPLWYYFVCLSVIFIFLEMIFLVVLKKK